MVKNIIHPTSEELCQSVVSAIEEKKGNEIVVLNLKELDSAVCDYFIVCHGNSDTQVGAIADFVEREIKTELHENPWHVEGKENKDWILIDYSNVVVHIFEKSVREFYKLEELWADANKTLIEQKQ